MLLARFVSVQLTLPAAAAATLEEDGEEEEDVRVVGRPRKKQRVSRREKKVPEKLRER